MTRHVAVWIDTQEAAIFQIGMEKGVSASLEEPQRVRIEHPGQPEGDAENPEDTKRFFHEVARSLGNATEVLVVGPSTGKLAFLRYAHTHDRGLEKKVVGVETVDHPSDGQIAAYARKYFERVDRLR